MILMLTLSEYVYDYDASYDEVDHREDSIAQSAAIVGGSSGIREPSQPPPPPQIAEPKVELRSFFPEDWLFSLEQLKETPVFER